MRLDLVPCPDCDGRGILEDWACEGCLGRGYVPVEGGFSPPAAEGQEPVFDPASEPKPYWYGAEVNDPSIEVPWNERIPF